MNELRKIYQKLTQAHRDIGSEEVVPLLSEPENDGTDGFIQIGRVEGFVIYPIDCGMGYKFKKATLTKNGIQIIGVESKYMVSDRTLVVFDKSNKTAILEPMFTMPDKSDEIFLYCIAQMFHTLHQGLEEITVNYLGADLNLHYFPADHKLEAEIQKYVFKKCKKTSLTLGYCSIENRRLLQEQHRFRPPASDVWNEMDMQKVFLPNFSNYTLINVRTFNDMVSEKCTKKGINYRNFRPQIIVNLYHAFAEDNIEEIKIGKTIFNRIIPCVTEATNYNHKKSTTNAFSEVYNNLKSNRTLFSIYPGFAKAKEPVLPIFGINMELKEDPNTVPINELIIRNEIISVKYANTAFPKTFNFKSTSTSTSTSTSASGFTSICTSGSLPSSTSASQPSSTSISTPGLASTSTADSAYASTSSDKV